QVALARGGIALTGVSGVPVEKARTSKLHQPNTFSAADRTGSPQPESISGGSSPPSIARSGGATRAEMGDGGGEPRAPLTAAGGGGWRGHRRQRLRQDDAGVA